MPFVKIEADPDVGPVKITVVDDRGNETPVESDSKAHAMARGLIEMAWEQLDQTAAPPPPPVRPLENG